MNTEEKLMEMGICFKPHGIRGAFTFVLSNNENSCLKKGSKVTLFPKQAESSIKKEGEVFTIDKIQHGNKVIVFLKGVADRNLVEAMIPFSIMIPRSEFPDAQEDEFYLSDIIGVDVYDATSNELIGKIKDFYDNSAQIVLVIKGSGDVIEVPFIEQFVPEVDIENNRVTIVVPEIIE